MQVSYFVFQWLLIRTSNNTLIRTSNLILNENYFHFNKKIYKQNGGVPMRLLVSGILAGFKLRKLEEIIIKKFKSINVH